MGESNDMVRALYEMIEYGVNLFDTEEVVNSLGRYGYYDEADWVYENNDDYLKLVQENIYG